MKLIYADLDAALPAVPLCVRGDQWIVARLHGEPLGIVHPPREGCTPGELARLVASQCAWPILRHLVADDPFAATLDDLAAIPAACPHAPGPPRATVTVAVCTRNRAAQLSGCLDALTRLDYPSELLDLLVIDNAPVDASTRDVVARYPRIRYVSEPAPGLDRARNTAARAARGEVIAYTDDDVSVDEGWVKSIAAAFDEEPHAMCVTGLVLPDEIDTDAQRLFERYGGFGRGFERAVYRVDVEGGQSAAARYGGTGRFGTGANMAFRRRFFEAQGYFDPALDVGTPTNGGGDLEMFFRVLKSGAALVYEPRATVRHRHRREYADLKMQMANNGIGFYSYLVRTAQAHPDERRQIVRLGVWWFWWWNVRRLLRSFVKPAAFPRDLIVAELTGSLAGLRRYQRARRWLATEAVS